jgi:hypothetical protein
MSRMGYSTGFGSQASSVVEVQGIDKGVVTAENPGEAAEDNFKRFLHRGPL